MSVFTPQFHGAGPAALAAARLRASNHGGIVIWSAPPKHDLRVPQDTWGYWSEDDAAMIREHAGERIVESGDQS